MASLFCSSESSFGLDMRISSSSMRVSLSICLPANISCLFSDICLIVQFIRALVSILAVFDIVCHVWHSSRVVHITTRF